MSKGSARRPSQVDDQIEQSEWDRIFGKPICVLTSNSTKTDRHYEEAGNVNEEMALHQKKMEQQDDDNYYLAG